MKVKVKIKMTKKEVDMLYAMLLIDKYKKIEYKDVVIGKLYLSDKQKKKLGTIDIC